VWRDTLTPQKIVSILLVVGRAAAIRYREVKYTALRIKLAAYRDLRERFGMHAELANSSSIASKNFPRRAFAMRGISFRAKWVLAYREKSTGCSSANSVVGMVVLCVSSAASFKKVIFSQDGCHVWTHSSTKN
jgi:hypothetical protein